MAATDPLFRRMLYNRGMTFAVIGFVLILGGTLFTVISVMKPPPAVPPASEASIDMPGLNNEEEFHRRVNELNQTAPGGAGVSPYGLVAVALGAASMGVGLYQMKMSRS